MKRLTVVSLILAGFMLTSHSAVSAAQGVKHCGLLSKQSAETVYGAPLDLGREMGMGCLFMSGGNDDKGIVVTMLPPTLAGAGMSMSTFYDSMLHQDSTSIAVPISGLGDRADFITSKGNDFTVTILVLYHNTILEIMASGSHNPNLKAELIQAMRQMMQKF